MPTGALPMCIIRAFVALTSTPLHTSAPVFQGRTGRETRGICGGKLRQYKLKIQTPGQYRWLWPAATAVTSPLHPNGHLCPLGNGRYLHIAVINLWPSHFRNGFVTAISLMKPPPGSRSTKKIRALGLLESPRYNSFFKAETTGVVIEICVKHPGGRTRNRGADFTAAVPLHYGANAYRHGLYRL
jgi:hypothetical protein